MPIPFSVFPSSYRSDAASAPTAAPSAVAAESVSEPSTSVVEEHPPHFHQPLPANEASFVDREDYSTAPPAPQPERYEPSPEQAFEHQLDITERDYRQRTHPSPPASVAPSSAYAVDHYPSPPKSDVSYSRSFPSKEITTSYDRAFQPPQSVVSSSSRGSSPSQLYADSVASRQDNPSTSLKVYKPQTVVNRSSSRKMGYYDDDAQAGADVRVIEPRGGAAAQAETVPIPCHFIRIGDILILQGRPCQVIRISVSPQTGQHRYLGVDLFTRQLQEESSFVSNPSPSVVVQTMLGPVYKTYRILDLRDDNTIVAMTESGDVRQGLSVIPQGNLFRRIRDAYSEGRGSVRALVINDGGRELVVDYKVIHASRL